MDFSDALRAAKAGKKIARKGWNGKKMWLSVWKAGTYHHTSEALENCPALVEYAKSNASECVDLAGSMVMKTADGSVVIGWLASQTDLLAEDWEVLP